MKILKEKKNCKSTGEKESLSRSDLKRRYNMGIYRVLELLRGLDGAHGRLKCFGLKYGSLRCLG